MQRHLVLRDADDAELVEEPLPLVAELFDEQVVRSPSSERGPRMVVLHHLGVAELGAVVRDYAAKQLAEELAWAPEAM